MCSCPGGCKAFPAASWSSAPGPPGHPDWTHTSAGAHTPFLTPCAAYFRFEIADRLARPLHPVSAVCHMLSYLLFGTVSTTFTRSGLSLLLSVLQFQHPPLPPPTRSLILLIPPNNYFVPSLLSNDCQRFYFITIL